MFQNLTTDDKIAGEKDTLGGSRVLDTDAYAGTIKLAYGTKAESEAMGLVLEVESDDGATIKQTFWMTSGKAKGCKNTYEKDGKTYYLPGFIMADTLAQLTTGKSITKLDTEKKVIKKYDSTAKAEIPTDVQMLTEMIGQRIVIGLLRQIVDKTVKNDSTNTYEPTGETREENEIDKLFCGRDTHLNMTLTEIKAGDTEATFYGQWLEKNKGQVRNKAKGASGTAGAPKAGTPAAAGTAKPTTSLFGGS